MDRDGAPPTSVVSPVFSLQSSDQCNTTLIMSKWFQTMKTAFEVYLEEINRSDDDADERPEDLAMEVDQADVEYVDPLDVLRAYEGDGESDDSLGVSYQMESDSSSSGGTPEPASEYDQEYGAALSAQQSLVSDPLSREANLEKIQNAKDDKRRFNRPKPRMNRQTMFEIRESHFWADIELECGEGYAQHLGHVCRAPQRGQCRQEVMTNFQQRSNRSAIQAILHFKDEISRLRVSILESGQKVRSLPRRLS